MSSPPKKPAPTPPDPLLEDLPEFPESTDALELLVDLDPGKPEPIGNVELEEEPDLLAAADEEWAADPSEPVTSAWPEPTRVHLGGFAEDDLEDFATQEELPILPWTLEVQLLEQGIRLPALLDLTAPTSTWERPDVGAGSVTATIRMRMLDLPVTLTLVPGTESRVRLGRDVLAGRVLVAGEG